jgi:signal transduction histidine kinase
MAWTLTDWTGRVDASPAIAGGSTIVRVRHWLRRYWVEVLWILFVVANTVAMVVFREWATVPFHLVWIGLSLLYGWRVWSLPTTFVALGLVILVTGFAMVDDVVVGGQPVDELSEIPLMSAVFVVMVWYVRHAVAASDEIARVSQHNLALLHRQREFIQDASHLLRTPLTIALGHAELMRATSDQPVEDLDVVIDELNRLKHISDRLLAMAATEQPDFIHTVDTSIGDVVTHTWSHWSTTHPELTLGPVAAVRVPHDPERVRDGLDELISNAIRHTPPGTPITLSASWSDGGVAVSVADEGPGIPRDQQALVFNRFARTGRRDRPAGLGLGLALVRAIAEAHGGRLSMRSASGRGTTFALWLPLAGTARSLPGEVQPGPPALDVAGPPEAPATPKIGLSTG